MARWAGTVRLLAVLPVAAALLLAAPAQAAPTHRPGHLLMLSVPGLTWADLDTKGNPSAAGLTALRGLVAGSAVANLSTRTVTSVTDPADGYATVGAGQRAVAGNTDGALAVDADEVIGTGTGADAYTARTGRRPTGAVLQLATGSIRRANDAELYGARPGLLGDTLHAGHRRTAVVANADVLGSWHREAALAVMDSAGAVDAGTVSPGLLTGGPAGATLDPAAVSTAVSAAWPRADVILVEAGDLLRPSYATNAPTGLSDEGNANDQGGGDQSNSQGNGQADAGQGNGDQGVQGNGNDQGGPVDQGASGTGAQQAAAERQRTAALRRADTMVGKLLAKVDPARDTVLLFSPAPTAGHPGMGVFALRGPGIRPGLAVSASTRRNGYVTLPDLAPTVLSGYGLKVPAAMAGTPITTGDPHGPAGTSNAVANTSTAAATAHGLAADNDRAVFRDRSYGVVTVLFLIMVTALAGLAIAAVWRPRLRLPANVLALAVLAYPSLTFLSGLVRYAALGIVGYPLVLLGASALVAVAGTLLARRGATIAAKTDALSKADPSQTDAASAKAAVSGSRVGGPWGLVALALVAVGWLVQVVDVLTGANLQLDTAFGYSPVVAGRFAGVGNQAFALLAATAVLLVGGGWAVLTAQYGVIRDGADGTSDAINDATGGETGGQTGGEGGGAGRRVLVGRWRWVALAGAAVVLVATVVVDGAGVLGADVGGVLAAVPGFAVVLALLAGVRLGWRKVAVIVGLTVLVIGGFAAVDLLRPADSRTHLGRFVAGLGSGDTVVIERKVAANLSVLVSSAWTWLVPVVAAFLLVWGVRRVGVLRRLRDRVPGLGAALAGLAVVGALGFALNDSGVAVPTMMAAVLVPYLVLLPEGDGWEADHRMAGAESG